MALTLDSLQQCQTPINGGSNNEDGEGTSGGDSKNNNVS